MELTGKDHLRMKKVIDLSQSAGDSEDETAKKVDKFIAKLKREKRENAKK